MSDLKQVQDQIRRFNQERDWDQFHTPENLAKSIAIEAGELLECFQWDNSFDIQAVCDELADVMNYCLVMADMLNVDPATILEKKLRQNEAKYPVEKCKGRAVKYTDL